MKMAAMATNTKKPNKRMLTGDTCQICTSLIYKNPTMSNWL